MCVGPSMKFVFLWNPLANYESYQPLHTFCSHCAESKEMLYEEKKEPMKAEYLQIICSQTT